MGPSSVPAGQIQNTFLWEMEDLHVSLNMHMLKHIVWLEVIFKDYVMIWIIERNFYVSAEIMRLKLHINGCVCGVRQLDDSCVNLQT